MIGETNILCGFIFERNSAKHSPLMYAAFVISDNIISTCFPFDVGIK